MKKGIFLSSAVLLGVLVLSGCNVFQSMDKPTGDDKITTSKYEAGDALNSGDYSKAYDKATEVYISKYSNVGSYADYQSLAPDQKAEFADIQTIRAEASLGKGGVDALNIVSQLQDLTKNTTTANLKRGSGNDSVTRITDIVAAVNAGNVDEAVNIYNTFLATTTAGMSITEKDRLKSTYQTAGIAAALHTAYKIIDTFDTNHDGAINSSDVLHVTTSGAVTSADKPKLDAINSNWKKNKNDIINGLIRAVSYLDVALESDVGQQAVDIVNQTKDTLNDTSDIGASAYNDIIQKTLAGK